MALETDARTDQAGWHGLAGRIIDWWHNGPRRSDLERIGASELAHMAQDLGLSAGDLSRLAVRDSTAGLLLYDRLSKLGLTAADIEKAGFRPDLERTCGLCNAEEVCRHDLEMRPDESGWKSYCPNCSSLETMQKLKAATDGAARS